MNCADKDVGQSSTGNTAQNSAAMDKPASGSLDNLMFSELCHFFSKVANASIKTSKTEIINKFLNYCRANYNLGEDGLFPVARLLLPQLDSNRGAYGVKEHALAKIYIRVLCLRPDEREATKLLKFRTPAAGAISGDFAEVAYWVLKTRCSAGGKYTIKEINDRLDNLADLHTNSVPGGFDKVITDLVLSMNADEQKWFIRLLLKDMRLGVGTNKLLYALHRDARGYHDVCNNLKLVCTKLKNPDVRLHELEVELFNHCRPMLADRCDVLDLRKAFSKSEELYLETKLDGERFQLHIDHGKYKYFSRNGYDYTDTFGETRASGVLTPKLAKVLSSHVVSCILDGEMMGWNTKSQCFGSKAMNFDVKHLREGSTFQPCFCVFDILLLNGEVLTNKPLMQRLAILMNTFTHLDGVMAHPSRKAVTTSQQVLTSLNNAIDMREEGIILKDPQSVYKPNDRKGGWFKIKPEYTDGLMDELDLIIIGGYYGESRRKANISHFLVAVAVPPSEPGGDPKEFHSVGRVGSGYTFDELAELLEKLSPHWRKVRPGQMPRGLCWTKERPDVWIEPKHSHILQIKATEIVPAEAYRTNYTLRFPRVEKVRYDKTWTECLTTVEFEKMRKAASGKLATRHVEMSDQSEPPAKRNRVAKVTPTLAAEFRPADLSGLRVKSNLLDGKEVCVLSGNAQISKQELEKKIVEHGGKIVQHRGPDTFCSIAGKVDIRVLTLRNTKSFNVAKVDWLLKSLDSERGQLLEWTPADLLAVALETEEKFRREYDKFDDSYTKWATEESLRHALKKAANENKTVHLRPEDYESIDLELFGGFNPFAIFRSCVAFFPTKETEKVQHRLATLQFRFGGGLIADSISEEITHIILSREDAETDGKHYKRLNHERLVNKRHVVTYEWVIDSNEKEMRLNEKYYYI